jgi:hypothetical protein
MGWQKYLATDQIKDVRLYEFKIRSDTNIKIKYKATSAQSVISVTSRREGERSPVSSTTAPTGLTVTTQEVLVLTSS